MLVVHHVLSMSGVFTMLCDSFDSSCFRCDREDSFVYAWFVIVASSVCLLHGLVLLPCGISGKMTATLDLTTIIAMLVASFYRFAALPITCLSSHPKLPWTSNLWHLSYANRCLAMLPLLLSPSYSVSSCRWSWRFLHGGQDFGWDITISLILLMHLYTW